MTSNVLNLNPLIAASLHEDPNAQRLALIERIQSWLPLPPAAAEEQCLAAVHSETEARKLNEMLILVRFRLSRELGVGAASTPNPQPAALQEKLSVATVLGAALLEKFPALTGPPPVPPDEAALRARLDALYQRQQEAQKYTVPPLVSAERLDAMTALVADYRALLAATAPGRQINIDVSFFAAHALYALARGWQQLGRNDLAARGYADSAPLFRRGERPADADSALQQAHNLGYAVRSDFDGASAVELRKLIDGEPDAYARACAYARLTDLSTQANSLFDAANYADEASVALASLGYVDLEAADFSAAFQAWIDACTRADALPTDRTPLQRINEVAQLYQRILSVRFASRNLKQEASAAAAEAAGKELGAAMSDLLKQIESAHEHVMSELARYKP